jgi:anti-sigma B factor antagonist
VSLLTTSSDGEILTICFNEARILDELVIRQAQEEVIELLAKAKERNVLLDFRRVLFLSSSALGALLRIHKKCKEYKIVLRMSNIAPDIMKVFKITNLDSIFSIHKDAEDALEAFRKDGLFYR